MLFALKLRNIYDTYREKTSIGYEFVSAVQRHTMCCEILQINHELQPFLVTKLLL